MPQPFHTRLTDAQAAALDAVATFTNPTTGLRLSVSRQDVVHSILDQWMAQHAPPPPETEPSLADIGRMPPDPKAELAARVRALRAAGKSWAQIVAEFTAEQIPTPRGKPGKRWSNSMLASLARYGLQDGA